MFVHGIGDQQHGSTAREGAACLGLALEGFRIDGIRTVDGVRLLDASSRSPRGGRTRIAVIDGWWDDVVEIPDGSRARAWQVLGWLARIGPVVLTLSGALAIAGGMARHERRHPRRAWGHLPHLPWLSVALQSVLWRGLIAPPLLMAALGLLAATLLVVRHPRVAAGVDHVLERVLGDAYAFCRNREAFDAMCERTRDVLGIASGTARRVVLVGHSQGAAISRAVCAEPTRVDALVTLGAGTQQLGALRQLKVWHTVYGWLVVLVYPGFVSLLLYWFVTEVVTTAWAFVLFTAAMAERVTVGPTPRSSVMADEAVRLLWSLVWSPTAQLGLALIAVGILLSLAGRNAQVPAELTKPRVQVWHDVSSILDPVCPGGGVLEEHATATEVTNTARPWQALYEHTRYLANPQVAQVIVSAVAAAGVRGLVPRPLEPAVRRQRLLQSFGWWGWPITVALSVVAAGLWWLAVGALLGLL